MDVDEQVTIRRIRPLPNSKPTIVDGATAFQESIVKTEQAADQLRNHVRPVDYYSPWNRQEGFLQPDHMTRLDRFPKIFETAQKFKPDAKRILSFGCSTGEECQSLRKYFPDAQIVGVDLDWSSVQKARRTNKDENIFFHTDLGATGKYDLVLCLMVFFCMEYPVVYHQFETTLKKVHKYINEDGYLMIYTSDHHPGWVEEIATQYEPIHTWTRTHEKNKKEYYNGYYRRLRSEELLGVE